MVYTFVAADKKRQLKSLSENVATFMSNKVI